MEVYRIQKYRKTQNDLCTGEYLTMWYTGDRCHSLCVFSFLAVQKNWSW